MGAKDMAMTDDPDLGPLFRRLGALNDEGRFREELKDVIQQLGQAVTDLVAHIEESDPKATADRLASALKALTLPAPQVTVDTKELAAAIRALAERQVTLEASLPPQPAPVIHMMEPPVDVVYEIRKKNQYGGSDTVMTVTRKAARPPQGGLRISGGAQ